MIVIDFPKTGSRFQKVKYLMVKAHQLLALGYRKVEEERNLVPAVSNNVM